jgi:hypothetical protein
MKGKGTQYRYFRTHVVIGNWVYCDVVANKMKYIVTPYVALGFVLSSVVGIEYSCDGQEMFPEYTGSPFIFRQKSLGSSMTHYYSISGLVLNTAIWSVILLLFSQALLKLIEKTGNGKKFKRIYKGLVGVLILFTTLHIGIAYIMLGRGFNRDLNYWFFDLDNNAKNWNVECKGRWGMFLIPK